MFKEALCQPATTIIHRASVDFNLLQKNDLEKLKDLYSDLGTAYFLKECLRKVYALASNEHEAEIAFLYWCELAEASEIGYMKTMAKTIRKHLNGITGYWKHGKLTSAKMEGFNNKIGWLNRQAYGYRDYEYFKLKIYDLPNLNITKAI